MNRSRTTLLLVMAIFLIVPGGFDLAVAGKPKILAGVGTITGLTDPMVRQVVQRRDDNVGNILFAGTFTGNVDSFQARSTVRTGMLGVALDWTPLIDVSTSGGSFLGIFRQPAGGFYDLQIRPSFQGQAGQAVTVLAVGVGEVFITAGQSNSTNSGSPTGYIPTLLISSFNDGPGRGINPFYPGASWQWGIDPQPVFDETTGGSPWPTMSNNLANALGVPIGLYSAGCGGTLIEEWLPGFVKAPTAVTPEVVLFNRLTNAIDYFKYRSGVRAILWDQGESDYDDGTNPGAYQDMLATIIYESRATTGVPIKWMVARAASVLTTNLPLRNQLEQAQANVTNGVLTFLGPNTDQIGLQYRITSTGDDLPEHFNAQGLILLGTDWGIGVYNTPRFLGTGYLPAQ
jgi:Carbohydrate esterase, sialic acid-specific acetylesterase